VARHSNISPEVLLASLERLGLASRQQVAGALRVSPATAWRHLAAAERRGQVLSTGSGPGTRYAAVGPLLGREALREVPLYEVTERGHVQAAGRLFGLRGGRVLLAPEPRAPRWLLGETAHGLFDDLPFFLSDVRPQGFLGRQIAHALSEFPNNPTRWDSAQVLDYLLGHGVDLPGNLLVGEAAVDRFAAWSPIQLARADFPRVAEATLAGDLPGSSAGGEQPKFLAEVDGRQVLVKFSAAADGAEAERWRDLLASEHLALETLRAHGLNAVENRLSECGGRLFLEVLRFDRTGARGRLPAISLDALDSEYAGEGRGWIPALSGLARRRMLCPGVLETARLLETFAELIENSDRHLGNLTLLPDGNGRFALAPVYDMLPMRHAPVRGEVPPTPAFTAPVQRVEAATWDRAVKMAADFWRRAQAERRLSDRFRGIAASRVQALSALAG